MFYFWCSSLAGTSSIISFTLSQILKDIARIPYEVLQMFIWFGRLKKESNIFIAKDVFYFSDFGLLRVVNISFFCYQLAREQVHKAANPPSAEVPNVSPSPTTSALPVTVTIAATPALSTPSSPTVESSIAADAGLNTTTKISIVGEDALPTTTIEPTQPEGAPETAIGCSQSEGGPMSRAQPDSPATSAEKEEKKK